MRRCMQNDKKKQQIISGKQQILNVPQILLRTESKMRQLDENILWVFRV